MNLALLTADTWGMHNSDIGMGWWIVMMLGMVLFWGLVILGVVWVLREFGGARRHSGGPDDATAILDRRLAEGDITVKEYEQRRKILTG